MVPFTVAINGTEGNVTIRATNDRGFDSTSPTSILLTNGSADGIVTLMAPLNTPSGSDVTLTIEAEAPGGSDANYAVLRFSIVNTVSLPKSDIAVVWMNLLPLSTLNLASLLCACQMNTCKSNILCKLTMHYKTTHSKLVDVPLTLWWLR